MSIKAIVFDAYNHPAKNVQVFFKWASGQTTVYSDGNGIADSGREDTLVSITAYGKKLIDLGSGVFYTDAIFRIKV